MRATRGGAIALATAAVALLLFHPLREASPTGDDYLYLALGRHLDDPLLLLVQDSTASYFFRPVVMLLWWATSAVTQDPAVHYAINIGVHVGNGLLLLALLRRMSISPAPAGIAALAFVAHPTAFSAAAWLSVRFDLVSLAFGLGALIAVDAASSRAPAPGVARFGAVIVLTLACVLSKETGFAIAAVALLAAAWPAPGRGATPRSRTALAGTIAACMVAALAIRWIVLRPVVEAMYLRQGTVATLWTGVANWAASLPGFVLVRLGPASATVAWAAALILLAVLACTRGARQAFRDRGLARTAALGLALAALAALAQAPVASVSHLQAFTSGEFDFLSVTSARLYYVPFAGLCIAAAALGEAIARAPLPRRSKRWAAAAIGIAAAVLLTQSRNVGREVTAFTQRTGPVFVRATMDALNARTWSTPGCKIYLLETPELAGFFRAFLQTAMLQALPRGHPATRCFLLSEHAPWYNLLAADGLPSNAELPLETMEVGGGPFATLRLGNLTCYFLRIPDNDAVRDDPAATFFAYEDGRFVDVTADVRSRRRAVRFFDNRPKL